MVASAAVGHLPVGWSIRDLDRLLVEAARRTAPEGCVLTYWLDASGVLCFRIHRTAAEATAFARDWADDAGPRPGRLHRVNLSKLPPKAQEALAGYDADNNYVGKCHVKPSGLS